MNTASRRVALFVSPFLLLLATTTVGTGPAGAVYGPQPRTFSEGYWMVDQGGGVYLFGDAKPYYAGSCFSLPGCGVTPNKPIVGSYLTPDSAGYYMVGGDGGIYGFGDARDEPAGGSGTCYSVVCITSLSDAVSMAVINDSGSWGYAIATADGRMYNFGSSVVFNEAGNTGSPCYTPISCGLMTGGQTIVGILTTPDNGGYYFVTNEGAIFNFGDAAQYEENGTQACYNLPSCGYSTITNIIGMSLTPDGRGYWIYGSDGGVYDFGDAGYYGSLGGETLPRSLTSFTATPDGRGYWMVDSAGAIYTFGDAALFGSMEGQSTTGTVSASMGD